MRDLNIKYNREPSSDCDLCNKKIHESEPWLLHKNHTICSACYIEMIPAIYEMAGYGDGGLIHLIFKSCLQDGHKRKRRKSLANYQKIMEKLKNKYNFSCVHCGSKNNLTVDHIIPVSKGGSDNESNLQLMCRSCNSKKGNKYGKTS